MTARNRCRERGAAAVEFAILLPLLLLIIGGIVDFGRLFYAQNITVNAAREGVRMLALGYPNIAAATPGPDAATRVQQAMIDYQGSSTDVRYFYTNAAGTKTEITTTDWVCPTGASASDRVTVTVRVVGFKYFLLGAAGSLVGSSALTPPTPSGTATMRCGG